MSPALGYVLVFVGGGLGAAARHAVNRTALTLIGPNYPAGTLIVNIAGSIVMGMLASWFAFRGETTTGPERLFLTTGILGGFTTFSTYTSDTRALLQDGHAGTAAAYLLGTLVLGLLAVLIGQLLVRRLVVDRARPR